MNYTNKYLRIGGLVYAIAVLLCVSCSNTGDDLFAGIALTAQPQDAEYEQDARAEPFGFSFVAEDRGAISYQWYSAATRSARGGIPAASGAFFTPPTGSLGVTYYYLVITNEKDGKTTQIATNAARVTIIDAVPKPPKPDPEPLTLDTLQAYLDSQTGTADAPIDVSIAVKSEEELNKLWEIARTAGKYINLDLSASAVGAKFSFPNEDALKYVINLTLPNSTEIISGKLSVPNLKSVSGANVITIETKVFKGAQALTAIDFPKAQVIGISAFEECVNLTTVSLPRVQILEDGAFAYCENLATVSLPLLKRLRPNVFHNDTSLTTVNIPRVIEIDSLTFNTVGGTGTPLSLYMGAEPPPESGWIMDCADRQITVFLPDERLSSIYNAKYRDYVTDGKITITIGSYPN